MIKKIAITGPESTGKTAIAQKLAFEFQSEYVPEFARRYIANLDRPYDENDILKIAKKQIEIEDELAQKASRFLFCDTDLIVIKIWLDVKYRSCPEWIKDEIRKRTYDLTLLMNVDIPWKKDPQRENPENRQELFRAFVDELEKTDANYKIISGNFKERENAAIKAMKAL